MCITPAAFAITKITAIILFLIASFAPAVKAGIRFSSLPSRRHCQLIATRVGPPSLASTITASTGTTAAFAFALTPIVGKSTMTTTSTTVDGLVQRRRSPRLLHPSASTIAPISRRSTRSMTSAASSSESASESKSGGASKKRKSGATNSNKAKTKSTTVKAQATKKRTRRRPRKVTDDEASDTTSTVGGSSSSSSSLSTERVTNSKPKRKPSKKAAAKIDTSEPKNLDQSAACLPRTQEQSLKASLKNDDLIVIGVDEAGRGPLAGPVCAAAAYLPVDVAGITDSKKITKEEDREELYEKIVTAPGVRWAAAVVDAKRIDEINILQATMEAMRMATFAVLNPPHPKDCILSASVERMGCYVVCGATDDKGMGIDAAAAATETEEAYALVDGNRIPTEMPCDAMPMVKGDSREFSIGAASIIAKVTRDRLMHAYDAKYPEFNLKQHKGYPTAAHMAAVKKFGASPIHRRTFAPLKYMSFDEDGNIVEE